MTARYISIPCPKAYGDDGSLYEVEMSITVREQPIDPIYTGLLDAHGVPLFRVEDRAPIGFDPGRWKA